MIRYLIIGAVLYLAVLLLRRLFKQLSTSTSSHRDQGGNSATQATARCAHCGVFIPRNQALQVGTDYYCSREHLQAASNTGE